MQEFEKSTHFEISSSTLRKTQELESSAHTEVSSPASDKIQEPKKLKHLDISSPASDVSGSVKTSVLRQELKYGIHKLSPLPLATP